MIAVVLALAGCATAPDTAPRPEVTTTTRAVPGPVDSGVADAAAGTADYDDGTLVSYAAAEGDHFDAIAMRFGVTTVALSHLNPDVRPDALVPVGTVIALR
jgi:hypothetical protein